VRSRQEDEVNGSKSAHIVCAALLLGKGKYTGLRFALALSVAS